MLDTCKHYQYLKIRPLQYSLLVVFIILTMPYNKQPYIVIEFFHNLCIAVVLVIIIITVVRAYVHYHSVSPVPFPRLQQC